jgi:signal transduction histidine kinase
MVTHKMSAIESNEFLGSLLSNIPFGIIALDKSGNITIANQLAIEYLNLKLPLNDMFKHNILGYIEQIPILSETIAKLIQNIKDPLDLQSLPINDKYLDINARLTPDGSIIFIYDITRLKETEANAVQSIIAGQENERRRIAREIHDGIGPLLSFTKLELDSFIDDFTDSEKGFSAEKLANIRQTIDSITSDLRDLSHRLMPRLLEEFGLSSAFGNFVHRINTNTKMRVELYCNFNSETRFDKEIEINVFRCGQELINNAVKHSGANDILIQLIKHEKSIVLMVEDDGIGYEPDTPDQEKFGIGLTNIDTRVRSLNGEFIIESLKNKGTTASIEIPI